MSDTKIQDVLHRTRTCLTENYPVWHDVSFCQTKCLTSLKSFHEVWVWYLWFLWKDLKISLILHYHLDLLHSLILIVNSVKDHRFYPPTFIWWLRNSFITVTYPLKLIVELFGIHDPCDKTFWMIPWLDLALAILPYAFALLAVKTNMLSNFCHGVIFALGEIFEMYTQLQTKIKMKFTPMWKFQCLQYADV